MLIDRWHKRGATHLLLDSLGLFLVGLLVDFFNLALVLLFLGFLVLDFLLDLLFNNELNGVGNELGVLLDDILDATLLKILELVLLKVQDHLGATANGWALVLSDGEGVAGR